MQGLHWQYVLSQGSRATPERREIGGSWVRPNLEALCVLDFESPSEPYAKETCTA